MNNKSILYGLILLITLALTLGAVSAAEGSNETLSLSIDSAPVVDDVSETNNEFLSEAVNDDILSASNENDELSLSESRNDGLLSARNEDDDELSAGYGTFDNLKNDLKGSYVTLNRDYITNIPNMVQISNSMTIDGQGHYIDGNHLSRILYIGSGTVTLKNINFINGYHNYNAVEYGAAITVADKAKVIMENCTVSNSVGSYGAVVWQGNNGIILDSKFINNTGFITAEQSNIYSRYGGAIQWTGDNGLIQNSQFTLNSAHNGGAIHWAGSTGTVNNVIFYKNNAHLDAGALLVSGSNVNVFESLFVENTAGREGGGLVYTSESSSSNVDCNNFQRNKASLGGGAVIDGYRNSVTNSQFLSNHATYGGGALVEQGTKTLIDKCIIYNNTAVTYGGGASIKTGTISNSIVEGNNAIVGAGIYVIEGLITNVSFTDNNGSVGQDIAIINNTTIVESDFDYIHYYNLTDYLSVYTHQGQNGYGILENGDIAFCIEAGAKGPNGGYVDTSLNMLINHATGENVADYVKLLIYHNINEMSLGQENIYLARDIWNFTETDFRNNPSASSRVKDAIRRYDAGERVPNTNAIKQVNGGYLVYNFYTLVTSASNQNLFAFNITRVYNINPDLEVRKITLNKTVNVGEKTSFDIIVKNTGYIGLTNVFVKELSYEGLIYNSFTGDNWVNTGNLFKYLNSLEIGESASFTVEFNTTKPGNFTNIVVAGSSETEDKITNNTTEVVDEPELKPGMVVDKVSLTPSVLVGEQTLFLITVTNTGEVALGDVFVVENIPDGLTYADYTDKALWTKVGNTFYYNNVLGVGESANFTIAFNTHVNGTFVNCVVAGSNRTENDTAENKTVVEKADLSVEKVTITPVVYIGEEAIFEIAVKNIGEIKLHDVFVEETYFDDGLSYNSWIKDEDWTYSFVNGKHRWTLNEVLYPGEMFTFFVVFDTHKIGTFNNVVTAGSDNTDNKTAENKTIVYENDTPESNSSNNPDLSVEKIALEKLLNINEQAIFEIIVHNIGDVVLNGVTVSEIEHDGLKYADWYDHSGLWMYNGDFTWTLKNILYPGEYATFFVVFDTIKTGEFINIVSAISEETPEKYANDTVEVINDTPETPEEPTPVVPEEPEIPEEPTPEIPEEPEVPEKPILEEPEEPTPVVPEEPETPEEPTPVVPEEPETPEEPTPVVPEEPKIPEEPTPVVPEEPETPEEPTPVVPETPVSTEKPTNETLETPNAPNNVNNPNVLPEAGNPLIIVLLTLFTLGTATLRRKK